jgi:hypothetical protein
MRRNARNLLVLSGTGATRRWRRPMGIDQVVATAAAEIPDGDRVQLSRLEGAILGGQAVADVVHLLAELIDNAVWFSPPGIAATIGGQPVPGGYLIEVEDRGVGMTDEQLAIANERLRQPPEAGFADGKMLGFTVVGRLAARHGIKTQVRRSWYGGVAALVRLPATILDALDDAATAPARRAAGRAPGGGPWDPPAVAGNGAPPPMLRSRPRRLPRPGAAVPEDRPPADANGDGRHARHPATAEVPPVPVVPPLEETARRRRP